MVNGIVLPNEEVVIKDRLIYFIGNSFSEKTASDTKFIDGKGKYLLPGFWDMHFHLCWQEGNDALLFPALLKKGITGIRDMGGDLNMMQQFKTKLKNGEIMDLKFLVQDLSLMAILLFTRIFIAG